MKDIIKPVIVLASICLVVTAMLAYVNQLTQPVIKAAEEQAAAAARSEVLPDAKEFIRIDADGLPEEVNEIYKGSDNSGYVVQVHTKGYGGDIKIICGVGMDGRVRGVKTLSHSETSGVGTKAVDNNSGYRERFVGKTKKECADVDTITGATISSTAYKKAVCIAVSACEQVRKVDA